MSMTDEQIVKALECCENEINFCSICPYFLQNKENDFCTEDMAKDALALIKRQQADKERLEIELQTMRIAANSYKSRVQTLEMDNAQLHSDIVNANQNFDHINGLWDAEKEKVEKAKQKVINICKELQKAKAEIESLEADYENVYKQATADILASIADGGTSCEWCIDKHRAEAVREFAEFLIDKAENNVIRIGDLCDYVIDFNEMTEGKENG